MRVVAIIQARLGSKRLPGKVLMDIAGKSMIQHVVERASAIEGVDEVVLNVPATDETALTPKIYHSIYGIIDQEKDVLGSYLHIAEAEKADIVMRLTGDTPLIDPELCTDVLNLFLALQKNFRTFCYVANDTARSGYPDGLDCEVVSTEALRLAAAQATDPFEREHVMPWIRRHMMNYGILAPWGTDLAGAKWSVDTTDDLKTVRAIYSQLEPGQYGWRDTAKAWRSMT
jgi:spore coat polysaccharide biosynthesis protein SpsF (cytidylyltransferase family)